MKNRLIIILSTLFLLSSCNDILNIEPDGRSTLEKVFQDPETTAKYLSTCYNNLPQKGYWYFFWNNIPIAISDESWDCDDAQGLQIAQFYKGNASSNRHPLEEPNAPDWDGLYWTKYWKQIRFINVFLSNIPSATVESEEQRDRFTAEAHVLRAYFYLQLIKWYGNLPVLTEPIPVDYDYSKLRKNSFEECARQIVADCDAAIASNNLPWRITSEVEIRRMNKAIACAIRSEASLWAASPRFNDGKDLWEWAYQVNKESLDMLLSHGYELYTHINNPSLYKTAYEEYFIETADLRENPRDKETIWQGHQKTASHFVIRGLPVQGGGYMAGAVPTQELVDAYDMLATGKPVLNLAKPYNDETKLQPNYNPGSGYDPQNPYEGRDPRFYASIHFNGSTVLVNGTPIKVETFVGGNCGISNDRSHTRTGYYNRKYMHPEAGQLRPQDDGLWKHYRLGAVYLNAAEAAAQTGRTEEAMKYVNTIRHRAGFSPSVDIKANSKEEAILYVRHERQVELCYEEYRYFDTRRWCKPDEDNTCEKFSTGMRITRNGDNTFSYQRVLVGTLSTETPSKMSYEKKYHLLPIPLDEVSKLESQTGISWQNTGW